MPELIIITLCLSINSLLAAYEIAFVTVPKGPLKKLAENGNRDAARLIKLRDSPERALSIIQIGITLMGVISSAVGGAGASETLEPFLIGHLGMSDKLAALLAIIVVVIPITYLNVVIGELTPKIFALRNSLKITLMGSKILFRLDRWLPLSSKSLNGPQG